MAGHVYLVGMPGSGKSSVGQLLAASLGTPFVDLDAEVEASAGTSVPAIFEAEGEAGFREREADALRRAAAGSPAVVACGGGAVLRPENVERMRSTGTVVHLDAPAEVLAGRVETAAGDRPLLTDGAALARLHADRAAAYRAAAHVRVDASGPPERVAEDVRRALP
jgi:shikimate kinase